MYICAKCGEVFETPEYRSWTEHHGDYDEPYGEEVCPGCGSEWYEEAEKCKICGEWHAKDELYDGYCKDCLLEALTFESFLDFCLNEASDDEACYLEQFMLERVYGFEKCPIESSKAYRHALINDYKERTQNFYHERLMWEIRHFVDLSEFAEYLNWKEENTNA